MQTGRNGCGARTVAALPDACRNWQTADRRGARSNRHGLPDRLTGRGAFDVAGIADRPEARTVAADIGRNPARTSEPLTGGADGRRTLAGLPAGRLALIALQTVADGLQGRFRRDLSGRGSNGCGDCRADGQRWRGRRAISGDIGRNRRGAFDGGNWRGVAGILAAFDGGAAFDVRHGRRNPCPLPAGRLPLIALQTGRGRLAKRTARFRRARTWAERRTACKAVFGAI